MLPSLSPSRLPRNNSMTGPNGLSMTLPNVFASGEELFILESPGADDKSKPYKTLHDAEFYEKIRVLDLCIIESPYRPGNQQIPQ